MPTEAQLKAQMQAAIAKKKHTDVGAQRDAPSPKPTPTSQPAPSIRKSDIPHPAIYQSMQSNTPVADDKPVDNSEYSEAELIRTFFGRPIRVAINKKEVFFAVPDVLEMASTPEKQTKYSELVDDADTKKLITPLVKVIMFPSPNGGNERLDAAKGEALITIIEKLDLKFPGPIEKWLIETTNSLMVLIS
jgi:hypothetical protein